jgi:hypothetical protein
MKRILLVVFATLALALGLSAPASASNPASSCSGLVASDVAGTPGERAEIQRDVFQTAFEDNKTPGAVASEFSRDHLDSAGNCLG